MAILIEGVDLAALCGVLVLIATLVVVGYTFSRLAHAIDVSIFGSHPFHGVAVTIENTIVAGCNVGISALGQVAHDLWVGLTWSFNLTLQSLMSIPRWTHEALNILRHNTIPALFSASLTNINRAINSVKALAEGTASELAKEAVRLDAKIEKYSAAAVTTVEHELGSAIHGVETELTAGLHAIRTTIETDIRGAIATAESAGTEALGKLRAAEDAAIGSLGRAEDATAAKLREFIGEVPLTDIASVVAAVPLVVAAVNVLEAETGLGRAECRAKVKGICSTDPNVWANLLGSLVALELAFNLEDWVKAIVAFAELSSGTIEELVRG